jgi:hypothetical protein
MGLPLHLSVDSERERPLQVGAASSVKALRAKLDANYGAEFLYRRCALLEC